MNASLIVETLLQVILFGFTTWFFWQTIRGITLGKVKMRTGIITGDYDIREDKVGFIIAFIFASCLSIFGFWIIYMIFLGSVSKAHASQSQRSPICLIQGQVISEERRIEDLKGMSEGIQYNYHDIKVKVLNSDFAEKTDENIFKDLEQPFSCNIEMGSHHIFQGRKTSYEVGFLSNIINTNSTHYEGKCIQAKTNASGDGNFTYGNWIYDIEILNNEDCIKKP